MALLGCGAFVVPMQAAQSIRPWHTDEEVSKSIVVPSIPERIRRTIYQKFLLRLQDQLFHLMWSLRKSRQLRLSVILGAV